LTSSLVQLEEIGLMTMVHATLAGEPHESTTWAVNEAVPAMVGVPPIEPVEPLRTRPAVREPEAMENLYGGNPPVADSAEEYNAPTVPVSTGHASVGPTFLAVTVSEQLKVTGGFPL
jgi:hypothetical protein